jgi:hypothetical protein
VLVNLDASDASGDRDEDPQDRVPAADRPVKEAQAIARRIFEELQRGRIDRSLFTANANHYFSDQAVKDFASSLGRARSESRKIRRTCAVAGRLSRSRPRRRPRHLHVLDGNGRLEQYIVTASKHGAGTESSRVAS